MEKYSLIDLHTHSVFSHEKGVTSTPADLIDMAVRNAGDDRRVAISITDHNNVRATPVALQYIEDNNLEDRVDYISGAEFNTGTKSLGKFNYQGKQKAIFGSLHLLGYGFDHNDEEILSFCDLRAFHMGGKNIGDQICAGRNLIKQETGVEVPFRYLSPLIKAASAGENVYSKFISTVKNYSYLTGEPLSIGQIMNIVGVYFDSDNKHNDLATGKAKLDIEDMAQMIKNAGGICVVAHPTFITYKQNTILHDVHALDEFLSAVNSKKRLVDGMEFFYPVMSNFREFPLFYELARKHDLFLSAGSDYHGFSEKHARIIGKVFDVEIDNSESEFFFSHEIKNRMLYLPILDYIKYRKELLKKQRFITHIDGKGELEDKPAIIELAEIQKKAKAQAKPKIQDRFKGEMSSKKLDVLNAIKTLQRINTLCGKVMLTDTPANQICEINNELRAMLTTGFFSVMAANKHFRQFSFVQSNLEDFKHFVILVGVLQCTFEKFEEVSKDFRLHNKDIIKAIKGLNIKYASLLSQECIRPEIDFIETENGFKVQIKDEQLLLSLGLTDRDLISASSEDVQMKRSSALKKSLKVLNKLETLYCVILNDKVPEEVKARCAEDLESLLNSGIKAINATIINFYDVQYIEERPKEFREFVDYILALQTYSQEIEARNLPYASGNKHICEVFGSIDLDRYNGQQK